MSVLLVVLVALLDAPASRAFEPLARDVSRAVVRIVNQQEDESCLGSGAVVAVDRGVGLVVTCAHLFTEGLGDVFVISRDGSPQRAHLAAVDEANDLACLYLEWAEGPTLPVAAELPREGARLVSCGFGEEGALVANHGSLVCYATLSTGEELGVLEMTGAARHGDSGGPVLNARREVVAVIMGTDGQTVDGTHCRRIRQFLADNPLTASLRAKVAALAAQPASEYFFSTELSFDAVASGSR